MLACDASRHRRAAADAAQAPARPTRGVHARALPRRARSSPRRARVALFRQRRKHTADARRLHRQSATRTGLGGVLRYKATMTPIASPLWSEAAAARLPTTTWDGASPASGEERSAAGVHVLGAQGLLSYSGLTGTDNTRHDHCLTLTLTFFFSHSNATLTAETTINRRSPFLFTSRHQTCPYSLRLGIVFCSCVQSASVMPT